MAVTPAGGSPLPLRPDDVADDITPSETLAPHDASQLSEAEYDLMSRERELCDILGACVDTAETEIRAAEIDTDIVLSSMIGAADSAISDAVPPIVRAIERVMDGALREIVTHEYTLRSEGVTVPYDWRAIPLILDDTTGELMYAQLTGATIPFEVPIYADPLPAMPGDAPPMDAPNAPPVAPTLAPEAVPDDSDMPDGGTGADTGGGGGTTGGGGAGAPSDAIPVTVVPRPVAPSPPPPMPGAPRSPTPPPPPLSVGAPSQVLPQVLPYIQGAIPLAAHLLSPPPPPSETAPIGAPPGPRVVPVSTTLPVHICEAAAEAAQWYSTHPFYSEVPSGAGVTTGPSEIARGITGYMSGLLAGTFGQSPDTARAQMLASYALSTDILGGYSQLLTAMELIPQNLMTDRVATTNLALALAAIQSADTATGAPLMQVAMPLTYLYQWMHPYRYPDQSEIDAMYLQHIITQPTWECLTRAQGNDPLLRAQYLQGAHARPDIHDIVQLELRDALTPVTAGTLWDRAAVRDDETKRQFRELAKWYPQPPDIVRFMVRDVVDPAAIERGKLDDGFVRKFYGGDAPTEDAQMYRWAKAHGLTEETFRYFWRAHWELPSNTALYEMLHRLRRDRPEWQAQFAEHQKWLAGGKQGPEPIFPVVVDAEAVRRTIEQNDMAPGYVDALMEISYRPMTRTDAVNAYHANLMDDEELRHRFLDIGHDAATASRMVEIQRNLRQRRLSNVSGVWTVRKILDAYRRGTMLRAAADGLLAPLVVDPQQRAALLRGVDLEASEHTRSRVLASIRRGYFVAAYDRDEASKRLRAMGIDPQRERDLLEQWTADRDGRYREVSARQILQWQTSLIITAAEALTRLTRLGYMRDDAERMVMQGVTAASERVAGKIERAQNKIEQLVKSQRSAARQHTQDLRARRREIEKQMEKLKKEQERIRKELDARQG